MSTQEIMLKVQEAEKEAEETRRQASLEARAIIKGVESATVQEARQASIEIRGQVARFHEEKRGGVDAEIDAFFVQDAAKIDQEKEAAQGRLDAAVRIIYERIVSYGDR